MTFVHLIAQKQYFIFIFKYPQENQGSWHICRCNNRCKEQHWNLWLLLRPWSSHPSSYTKTPLIIEGKRACQLQWKTHDTLAGRQSWWPAEERADNPTTSTTLYSRQMFWGTTGQIFFQTYDGGQSSSSPSPDHKTRRRCAPMVIDQIVNTDMNGNTQTAFYILHLEGKPVIVSAIDRTAGSTEKPHPVIFEWITGSLIQKMVLQTEGAVGPSGMDAQSRRCLCTLFKEDLAALWNFLASVQKNMLCICWSRRPYSLCYLQADGTGQVSWCEAHRHLLELLACLGGLGVTNATKTARLNHHNSVQLTRPLVDLIQQHA